MECTLRNFKAKVLNGFPELLKIISKGRFFILMNCLLQDTVAGCSTTGRYVCFLNLLRFIFMVCILIDFYFILIYY
jgi:hypothetical protein